MYRSLLVPLDGSPFAEQALPMAVDLCTRSGATLHLVMVHDALSSVPCYGEPVLVDAAAVESCRLQEQEYLKALAGPLVRRGIAVVTCVVEGPVARTIVEYTNVQRIDLVVMTTHGRGVFSRFWIGSVADRLVRHLDVPMLVLRPLAGRGAPTASQMRRIVVPLDGSPLAEAALEPAAQFAGVLGAGLTLYRAILQAAPLLLPYPGVAVMPEQVALTPVLEEEATRYLEALAARLRARGLQVDTAVELAGDPVAAISTWAERHGADLIAMATHGHGGTTRLLLGSVADKLLRSAEVPLLLFRPGERVTDAGTGSGAEALAVLA
jgi:nucleotide-binding universal stress UspA family protein